MKWNLYKDLFHSLNSNRILYFEYSVHFICVLHALQIFDKCTNIRYPVISF